MGTLEKLLATFARHREMGAGGAGGATNGTLNSCSFAYDGACEKSYPCALKQTQLVRHLYIALHVRHIVASTADMHAIVGGAVSCDRFSYGCFLFCRLLLPLSACFLAAHLLNFLADGSFCPAPLRCVSEYHLFYATPDI